LQCRIRKALTSLSVLVAVSLVSAVGAGSAGAQTSAGAQVGRTAADHSIVGKWSMSGGIFQFVKKSGSNTYWDKVIKKRKGVFCPTVNDRNDQIVLHKKSARVYTGTWKWFFTSCTFAGLGATTVTVSTSGKKAVLVSHPPKAIGGSTETLTLVRLK
jgi:hypothetical protein